MKRILRSVTFPSVLILLAMLASSTCLFGQSRTVTGIVKSGTDVLPGVTVLEKGTNNGTVTDSDGKFTISVSGDATLVISFVGMRPQEVQVGNRTSVDVNLEADITQLSEVVVIGYGTAKKSDLTGSVASISGDDLKKVPVSTVAESLTGRLPGVQVSTAEGSPDAEVRIRIRGGGSITQDNSPLYIVDGFPINNIADISPSDIKSIDVLKDASSTAIYGSRGANGVIIITTKSGVAGKVTVNFNSFFGIKKIAKTQDVLDVEDYVSWQYENALLRNSPASYENFFGPYADMDLYSGMKGNNWQDQVYGRTGNVFSNDFSIRGGSDKIMYSLNYARFDERAIMVGSDYERNNISVKLNAKPTDRFSMGFSLRYADTKIAGGGANEQNETSSTDSRLKYSIGYPAIPINGLTSEDTDEAIANYLVNPLVGAADNDRDQHRKNFNFGANFAWDIIDDLQFSTELGLDNYYYSDNRFYGLTTYYIDNIPAAENQGKPAAILRDRKEVRYRITNILGYDFNKFLNNNHHAKVQFGQEILQNEVVSTTSTIHGFPTLFSSGQAFRLTSQGDPLGVENFYNPDEKLLSFFGRLIYDYKSRYLLWATYRADGSSKFSEGNRWGFFPSVSGAWKISEEGFMQGTSSWMNSLKVRLSFGNAGNNNIPPGQIVQTFEAAPPTTWMNGFDTYWAASTRMANPDLKWETTQTINAGLDFGFMQDRLTGTLEFYKNNTKNLLIEFPTPGTGYQYQFRNMGETENKGMEVSLNYKVISEEKYGLSVAFNIGFNRNEVKSLETLKQIEDASTTSNWASTAIGPDYRVVAGMPLGLMLGYQSDGRYEVSDFEGFDGSNWTLKAGQPTSPDILGTNIRPGMMKLKDVTGDGIVNLADRRIIGNANPKHTGGITLNGYAFGFDLTAAFNWSYGNDVYNADKIDFTTSTLQTQYKNLSTRMEAGERWTNVDPATGALVTDPTALAALNENTTMWSPFMRQFVFSDWAVEDGSFLRLNTLTLGYTIPTSLTSRLKVQNLRFYATGYNVFIITDYSGFDPEVSTRRRSALTPGVDYSAYPRSRQIVFGLNLTF